MQLYIKGPQILFVALSIPEILVPTLWLSLSRFTSGKANSFGAVRIFPFFFQPMQQHSEIPLFLNLMIKEIFIRIIKKLEILGVK